MPEKIDEYDALVAKTTGKPDIAQLGRDIERREQFFYDRLYNEQTGQPRQTKPKEKTQ